MILSDLEAGIKAKIEAIGTPLKEWDIQINYGIKTGFNEAFIIDSAKRNELLKKCPEGDEIIRPILRGRDVKKYNAQFADQWLINTHNGIKERSIEPVNVQKDFPAIFEHLKAHEEVLTKRLDQGKHWSNLRNCAYLEDFNKEKIIWIELTDHPNFALDSKGFFLNNTVFFMTGGHLKYLLAFLNSRLCEWYFDKIAATSGAGTRRWIKMYIDQICVPKPNITEEEFLNNLVDKVQCHRNIETLKDIDIAFYKMFKLENEEINVIESAVL